mgnify:CR=1 FL=1
MEKHFEITNKDRKVRTGILHTSHGSIETPAFAPTATIGVMKSLLPTEVIECNVPMLLANLYHLYLRPGIDLIENFGGLHKFMKWKYPILTDSGGFQAFSLSNLVKLTNSGITFRSHIDGTSHLFTPKKAYEYQKRLGSDIIMCLDHCVAFETNKTELEMAVDRTSKWAQITRNLHSSTTQKLFGIIQGGTSKELRIKSTKVMLDLNFDGYAIGGLAVGEPKKTMYEMLDHIIPNLPEKKPRYLMGVGAPDNLVEGVARGIDLFDCALPSRVARTGAIFTWEKRINILKKEFKDLDVPLIDNCKCIACKNFPIAYIHHLFKINDPLGLRLATIHNLVFIQELMNKIRKSIHEKNFLEFKKEFLKNYATPNEQARLNFIQKKKLL